MIETIPAVVAGVAAVTEMGSGARKPALKPVNNRFGFGSQRPQPRLD